MPNIVHVKYQQTGKSKTTQRNMVNERNANKKQFEARTAQLFN